MYFSQETWRECSWWRNYNWDDLSRTNTRERYNSVGVRMQRLGVSEWEVRLWLVLWSVPFLYVGRLSYELYQFLQLKKDVVNVAQQLEKTRIEIDTKQLGKETLSTESVELNVCYIRLLIYVDFHCQLLTRIFPGFARTWDSENTTPLSPLLQYISTINWIRLWREISSCFQISG